ncbi:MAG: sigma-70 family RNA polymerase sigma factor [Phycisphaerales bacterium]|nr:sigma-70 family RNA polymerase sigma factor [Phycisphaerales bacterium]
MFASHSIDDEMVCAAVRGSNSDRDRIVQALTPQVRAMVMVRLMPTPAQFHTIDELTQESLMALSEGLDRLRQPTVEGLKSFVSKIVSHKVIDFLRRHDREKNQTVASLDSSLHNMSASGPLWTLLSDGGLSPSSVIGRSEQAKLVLTELARLKQTYREVITLAFFDQLPATEIAERMEITRSAASMLLIRAVKTLRRNVTGSSRC